MTKKFWVLFGTGIIIFLFLLSLIFLTSNKSPSNNSGNSTATGSNSSKLVIQTKDGTVSVNDITKHPIQKVSDNLLFENSKQYSIVYFPEEKAFSINILQKPLKQSRDAAESALLKDLNIDFAQACKLLVQTFVPFEVDQTASGQDYGLSFCPSGRQIE